MCKILSYIFPGASNFSTGNSNYIMISFYVLILYKNIAKRTKPRPHVSNQNSVMLIRVISGVERRINVRMIA